MPPNRDKSPQIIRESPLAAALAGRTNRDPSGPTRIAKASLAATLAMSLGVVMALVFTPNASASLVTKLTSTADTTVRANRPSTNYGTSGTLYGSPIQSKSFLRFPTAQIDDTAVITSAKLRVYGSTTSTSRWEVRTASRRWSEATTYATRPEWSSKFLGRSATGARAGVWNEIQLPVSAVSKTSSTNFGVRGTVTNVLLRFKSRETTKDPQLILTYGTQRPAPSTPTPTPTPPPASTPTTAPAPLGVPGAWTLAFADEFNGTSLDTSKWSSNWFGDGGKMNNLGTYTRNVSVSDGELRLQLADENGTTTGALIHTGYSSGRYQLPVGGYSEARVYFPGSSEQNIYNWPAWWTSGPSWPSAGEHDVAEGLGGKLTVNYHGTSNSGNYGTPTGTWHNTFHTYGVHRKATSADVYWDGKLVESYPTGDNSAGQELILNVGKSSSRTPITGAAGAMRVDYVRAWR